MYIYMRVYIYILLYIYIYIVIDIYILSSSNVNIISLLIFKYDVSLSYVPIWLYLVTNCNYYL